MSKFAISTFCLVVGVNLLSVSHPVMSANELDLNRAIYPQLLAESSTQQDETSEDEVFDDIVLNRVDKLRQFLSKGGSPDRYFNAAINANAIDCVKLMIARGANVNLAGDEGVTPLMTSVRVSYRGTVEITELLIKKGANVNAKAGKGSTALMYASSGVAAHYEDNYVDVVRLLIKSGAKVNIKNQMGATPLSIAQEGKWKKIVAVLKKAGAKV
jgi:uncharacterized protein